MTSEQLDKIVANVKGDITRAGNWHESTLYNLPRHSANPYARIKYGTIHSNGVHEAAIGYYTVYWDGSVLRRNSI